MRSNATVITALLGVVLSVMVTGCKKEAPQTSSAPTPQEAAMLVGEQPFYNVLTILPEPGTPVQPETLRLYGDKWREMERLGLLRIEKRGADTILEKGEAWPPTEASDTTLWDKSPRFEIGRFTPDGQPGAVVTLPDGNSAIVKFKGTFKYAPWAEKTSLIGASQRKALTQGVMNYRVVRRAQNWVFTGINTP